MGSEVTGKIAKLLTSTRAAIAIPAGADVKVDDTAVVFKQFDIQDPDTGEDLGSTRLTVIRLKVASVEDRFCVARSFESIQKAPFDFEREILKMTTSAADAPTWVTVTVGMPVSFKRG